MHNNKQRWYIQRSLSNKTRKTWHCNPWAYNRPLICRRRRRLMLASWLMHYTFHLIEYETLSRKTEIQRLNDSKIQTQIHTPCISNTKNYHNLYNRFSTIYNISFSNNISHRRLSIYRFNEKLHVQIFVRG